MGKRLSRRALAMGEDARIAIRAGAFAADLARTIAMRRSELPTAERAAWEQVEALLDAVADIAAHDGSFPTWKGIGASLEGVNRALGTAFARAAAGA